MNQVSRPMQIMLIGVLVFAALWMTVLKPKNEAVEPVAATPVTTSPVAAGGQAATSAPGKAVEAANNAAATANAATAKDEAQTGEQSAPAGGTPAGTTPAGTAPAGTAPAATTPAGTTPAAAKAAAAKARAAKAKAKAKAKKATAENAAQRRADRLIEQVGKDLKTRHAVVVLVASKSGAEDKVLRERVRNDIDRRKGRVKVYIIDASEVGVYDGLLGSLNVAQTPSTIVIAPNSQAKVIGGLTSVARIDRLTSAAVLVKPEKTTP